MERPQLVGTDVERCAECRGHVIQLDEESVCTSCGVVAMRKEPVAGPTTSPSPRLGSFIGRKEDGASTAGFDPAIARTKRIADTIGLDQGDWNCKALTKRVADKLALPPFVRESADVLSGKMLARARETRGVTRRRTSVPAISAYALLAACRSAGMDHVGSRVLLQTYADLGHTIRKSRLLWLGTQESAHLRPADPAALLRSAVASLESNGAIRARLAKYGVEPRTYFRRLLQTSQAVVEAIRAMGEGRNPRTITAGSLYLASREVRPGVVTQRDAAEALGVSDYTVREFVAAVSREFCLGPLRGPGL